MKARLKEKWLAALRGKEYKQGQGYLRQLGDDHKLRYCCLGVLSDIAGVNIKSGQTMLSKKTLKKVGLSEVKQYILAAMNDGTGYCGPNDVKVMYDSIRSFKQIARWIEKHL